MQHLLSTIIVIPAVGALFLALLPAGDARLARRARAHAIIMSSLTLGLSLVLWIAFQPRGVQWQFLQQVEWGFAPSGAGGASPWTYIVGVDGFGALLVVITTAVIWCAILLGAGTSDDAIRRARETLALEAAIIGAVTSLNLLFAGVFWTLALVAAWRLLAINRTEVTTTIVRRFAIQASVAVVMLAAAIVVLTVGAGVHTVDLRALQQLALPEVWQAAGLVLFVVACAITSGVFPFHIVHRDVVTSLPASAWLPIAVALSNLGTFGLLRVGLPLAPDAMRAMAPALALVAVVGAVSAIILGARQTSAGPFTAHASLAQVSAIFLSSTALTPLGLTATVIQHVSRSGVMLALALTSAGAPVVAPRLRWIGGVALAVLAGIAIYPAPIEPRIETAVARVILRVSPQHAAEVADCLTASQAPPPPPAIPGLPANASMAAPCETNESKK